MNAGGNHQAAELLSLVTRVGRSTSQKRLQLQVENSATLYGASRRHIHLENIHAVRVAVESILAFSGFRERAQRNCCDYRLEHNHIYLPGLPDVFDGYTILHLSDLHSDGLVDRGAGIIRIIKNISCDIAVVTGDFRFETNDHYDPCLEILAPIVEAVSAHEGIYGILGNHDFLEMVPALERMGVRMLLNEAVTLRRSGAAIMLAGVDDPHFYECHDLPKALASRTAEDCVILLAHSPEIAAEAAVVGINLYLCGHTHGGQICLPGRIPIITNTECPRAYMSGSWACNAMQGYTSRGTGFSTAAARFFCPPEITLHTLHTGKTP